MIAAVAGLPGLQTSIRIETLFASDSRVIQDYHRLEEHIGPLVPIEILVAFDKSCQMNDQLRMNIVWRVNNILLKHPDVKSTTSALTISPSGGLFESLPPNIRPRVIEKSFPHQDLRLEEMAFLRHTVNREVWRVTAHVNAMEKLDYGQILNDLRTKIQSDLKIYGDQQKSVTVTTSGIMPLVHQIQRQLLDDLFRSLLNALLVITLTITIVEAGVINGILVMLSNVFPIVIALGCMGWLAHPMDIGPS